MNIQPDFAELLKLLEKHNVRYMVVGGYAVAFYGYPRFTKDIDVFYQNSESNIENLRKALISFGFSESELPAGVFAEPGNVLKFGIEPVRIDLLNEIDGVDFEAAAARIKKGEFDGLPIRFISLEDLIINKKASGRAQDKVDIDLLGKKP